MILLFQPCKFSLHSSVRSTIFNHPRNIFAALLALSLENDAKFVIMH